MTTVRWLDGVPSTQEVAHWMAEDGAPHGAAVAAREQLAGRGTRGREWYSPIGGLWMSVVCRPRHAVSAACSALRAGLAAAAAVEARVPAATPIALKWPNDLYRDGRKLGGILCEARWQGDRLAWIVVGVGINVRNTLPPALEGRAGRLAEVDRDAHPETLAGPIAEAIATALGTGGPLTDRELAGFADRDQLRGRMLAAPVQGVADGIDADGALLVRDRAGVTHRLLEAGVEVAGV